MMADFNQALKWLKEGKNVHRGEHWYLKISDDEIVCLGVETNKCAHISQSINLLDIDSQDWEIYEVQDKWNIKTTTSLIDNRGIVLVDLVHYQEQLRKLKTKISEDLKQNANVEEVLTKRFGF